MNKDQILFVFKTIWESVRLIVMPIYLLLKFWPLTLISICILDYVFPVQGKITFDFIMPTIRNYINAEYLIWAILGGVIIFFISSPSDKPEWENMKNREEQLEKVKQKQQEQQRRHASYIASKNWKKNNIR